MIKTLVCLTISFASITANAQSSTFIRAKGYKGYVFDSAYNILKSIDNQRSRFTPSPDNIKKAEELLRSKISQINKPRINQPDGCPIIDRKLKKYTRQYVGFINQKGEMIIWINLFWTTKLQNDPSKDIIRVSDGCSYFWSIEINIISGSLNNFRINGLA